jgi:hypothetical protein
MLVLSAILAFAGGYFHAAKLYMSHALAPRLCSLPLAAACRVTLHQVNGVTGRGLTCGNNGSSRQVHQASRAAAAGDAQTERDPSQFAASAVGNGAAEIPAAMADIRTMLIDLDDCLYDIPVRPSCASTRMQTAKRRVTASMQMRSQRALSVLSDLIWRQVLRRHSVTAHASHSIDSGLASCPCPARAPQRSLEFPQRSVHCTIETHSPAARRLTQHPRLQEFPKMMAANIQKYMERRLAFPAHNIQEVCADLYMGHGTTLAGLVVSVPQFSATHTCADLHMGHGTTLARLVVGSLQPMLRTLVPSWTVSNFAQRCDSDGHVSSTAAAHLDPVWAVTRCSADQLP